MKTNPFAWLAAVLLLLLAALWWEQTNLRSDLAAVRAELAKSPRIHADAPPDDSFSPASPTPAKLPEAATRIGTPEPVETTAVERLIDLERVVHAQADLIESLLGRFQAMDEQARKAAARSWGPEQAAGAPDTMQAGDYRTAWAPAQADGGVEWIEAEFENPADLAQIVVRQTSNPGSITKVVALTDTGTEVPIWSGEDPSKGKALDDTAFNAPAGLNARRVKVYLDTSKTPGWEEIDAFQLVGRDGSRQWAKSVNASSTYASGASQSAFLNVYRNVPSDGGLRFSVDSFEAKNEGFR